MGWIGCAIQQVTSKGLPGFFFCFNILIFIYFFKYETISTFAPTFWTHIISELGGVCVYVLHFLQVGRDMGFSGLSFKSNLALNIGDKVFPMDAQMLMKRGFQIEDDYEQQI